MKFATWLAQDNIGWEEGILSAQAQFREKTLGTRLGGGLGKTSVAGKRAVFTVPVTDLTLTLFPKPLSYSCRMNFPVNRYNSWVST